MSKRSKRADKLDKVPKAKLEKEVKRSRELLKMMGAAYYASLLTAQQLGKGRLPPQMPVLTEWLRLAHSLMDGQTLQDPDFSISEGNPEDSYVAFFEDSQGNTYIFTHNLTSGATTLRAGEDERILDQFPPEPEVHMWFQACLQAAMRKRARKVGGMFEMTYTAWDVIYDIAEKFRVAMENGTPVDQTLNITVMERAHQIASPFLDQKRGTLLKKEEPKEEAPPSMLESCIHPTDPSQISIIQHVPPAREAEDITPVPAEQAHVSERTE